MFNAKTKDGLVSQEYAKHIVDLVSKIEPWEGGYGSSFWDNRSLNAFNIYENYDKELGTYLFNLRSKIKEAIIEMYDIKKEIYPDLLQVVRWFPGMEQPPHADDMTNVEPDGINRHRDFGAIIYLNTDYSGGHTYYPQYDISIKPEIGKLAVHPGDVDHLHGVSKIEGGMRYTIASFWTYEEEYYDHWNIHQ